MAKKPKIQRMKTASRFLIVAFIGLMAAGIAYLDHRDILTGTEIIGSAFIPLATAFGFHFTHNLQSTHNPQNAMQERFLRFLVWLYWQWTLVGEILYSAWFPQG